MTDKRRKDTSIFCECIKVSAVYTYYRRTCTKSPLYFLKSMSFNEYFHSQRTSNRYEMCELFLRENTRDKENRVRSRNIRFVDLVFINDEVFTKDGKIYFFF